MEIPRLEGDDDEAEKEKHALSGKENLSPPSRRPQNPQGVNYLNPEDGNWDQRVTRRRSVSAVSAMSVELLANQAQAPVQGDRHQGELGDEDDAPAPIDGHRMPASVSASPDAKVRIWMDDTEQLWTVGGTPRVSQLHYVCGLCRTVFEVRSDLDGHVRDAHPMK